MPVMPEDRIAERSRAIEAALLNIEKRFGKGSIMRLGEREISDIPAISTTSLSLDAAIVVDSVAALVPRAELDGEMGDSLPGLQARLMSQALRKLTAIVAQSNTCFIFINQIREKIGVMFGNPETTSGGRALKFYSSLRLDIRRIGAIKDGDRVVGNRTKVKVAKNKVAPPFREAEFDIMYGEGISQEGELLDPATDNRIVEKSGAWFSYKGERLGQGRENAKQTLKDQPVILEKIKNDVKRALGMTVREEPEAPEQTKAAAATEKK